MSGVPLETCWAFNERWNNKFYYKVASCWLFLLNHTTMHGSMNIKSIMVTSWTVFGFWITELLSTEVPRCWGKWFILVTSSTVSGFWVTELLRTEVLWCWGKWCVLVTLSAVFGFWIIELLSTEEMDFLGVGIGDFFVCLKNWSTIIAHSWEISFLPLEFKYRPCLV